MKIKPVKTEMREMEIKVEHKTAGVESVKF
jgi:hypothetical protein